MVLFGQSGSNCEKVVVIRQSGCIRAKVVVFGKKLLYSGKSGCVHAKWLYLGKVVVFGQRLFYLGKSACIVAKLFVIG